MEWWSSLLVSRATIESTSIIIHVYNFPHSYCHWLLNFFSLYVIMCTYKFGWHISSSSGLMHSCIIFFIVNGNCICYADVCTSYFNHTCLVEFVFIYVGNFFYYMLHSQFIDLLNIKSYLKHKKKKFYWNFIWEYLFIRLIIPLYVSVI